MKKVIYISIIIIGFLSCNNRTNKTTDNHSIDTIQNNFQSLVEIGSSNIYNDIYFLVEKFVDSTSIGQKGHNKVEISYYVNDSLLDAFVRLFFWRKGEYNDVRETDWWYTGNFIFDGSQGLTWADKPLETEISDFNNDGYNDFTYRSIVAARGGNDIRKLFIYNPKENKFIYIKNSEVYPNLRYNKETDCITSYIYTATQSQYFLKLDGDSLVEIAYIEIELDEEDEMYIYVYEIDKNNNKKLIEQKKTNFDIMPYYSNYKPLRKLK